MNQTYPIKCLTNYRALAYSKSLLIIQLIDSMNDNYLSSPDKPTSPQFYQYAPDYQGNAYSQQTTVVPGTTFAQSQAGRADYYPVSATTNAVTNRYYTVAPSSVSPVVSSGSRVQMGGQFVSSQVKNQQVVKGQSRINYVPYQKKIIQYQDRQYIQRVPIKKKVTQYEQRRVIETIPHEVTKTEYYALQKRVEYHKEIIPEKRIEMVPVQRKIKKYEYVPVEKQIVHYPQNVDIETAKGQSRVILREQGVNVKADAEFRPIDPSLIYNYSNRPESRYNPIGYVDQGNSRILSNAPTTNYAYYPGETGLSYSNAGGNYPFQNLSRLQSQPQRGYQVVSPSLMITDPQGRQQYQYSGESYIKELNNLNTRTDVKRPFEMIGQPGAKEGVSDFNQVANGYQDYGGYTVNEPGKRYGNFDYNNADWRIEK